MRNYRAKERASRGIKRGHRELHELDESDEDVADTRRSEYRSSCRAKGNKHGVNGSGCMDIMGRTTVRKSAWTDTTGPIRITFALPKECANQVFHHVLDFVSPMLVPTEDPNEDVVRVFVQKAVEGSYDDACPESQALYHINIALAAQHLSKACTTGNTSLKMVSAKHYVLATSKLRRSLEAEDRDFGVVLTTILGMALLEARRRAKHKTHC